MKILKLSPYCFPEQVSSSHLTKDLTEGFANADFYIENYVPTPTRGVSEEIRREYKKKKYEVVQDGHMIIHRFSMFKEGKNPLLRAFRYVLVNLIQYHKGVNAQDIDVIYAGSTPPTQGMLCSLVKKRLSKKYKRNVPFVFVLQDIFPDSLVNAKMTKKGSIIWKIGRKMEDFTYCNADKIIVISGNFKQNIMEKGVPEEKIVVIPNWVNVDDVYPVERKENKLFDKYHLDREKFYICYSGNVGHSQNLPLLLEAAKALQKEIVDLRFVLISEGAAKAELEQKIVEEKISNMIVLPFQDYSEIASVFSLGDAGLIISKPGIGKSSVPSKTWSIMAAERPVLVSFDEDSELSQLIQSAGCGITTKAGDLNSFLQGVRILYENQELARQKGKLGRIYLQEHLDKDTCVKAYVDVVNSVRK